MQLPARLHGVGASAACAGSALLWALILVAAKVYDGGTRLGAALLLLAGFIVGWLSGAVLGGPRRREGRAPRVDMEHETEDVP